MARRISESKFKETKDGYDYFNFVCEGCRAEGEVGIPEELNDFNCPDGCGSRYIKINNQDKKMILVCVVQSRFVIE